MTGSPEVSVVIASYNAAAFLETAIASALAQSLADIEVLVIDDASSDDSVMRARAMAERDPRVRVDVLPHNRGPGGARNRAIDLAAGRWLAVLDSDDLWDPERLERLIAGARADGADIVADNLLLFDELRPDQNKAFFGRDRSRSATWLTLEDYLRDTRLMVSKVNLGYLKPVFSLERLRASKVRYDESMRIAEDDDLLLRLLTAGLKCRVYPEIGYFYRRHAASISHRLDAKTLQGMIDQEAKFRADLITPSPALVRALDARRAAVLDTRAFWELLEAIKGRDPFKALLIATSRPTCLPLLRYPISAVFGRLSARLRRPPPPRRSGARLQVCLISRQRLVGLTNGSSVYLLGLMGALKAAGLDVHLVVPSPVMLGRWPVLKLKPEMGVFASIHIRGVARFGSFVVALDPRIYEAAFRGALAAALDRLRLPSGWLHAVRAGYNVAAPWSLEDGVFVAKIAPPLADRIVLDYVFQTKMLPYVLRPEAPSAIVMHDLFHAPAGPSTTGLGGTDAADSERGDGSRAEVHPPQTGRGEAKAALLQEHEEQAMMARVGTVVAIQEEEAAWVRRAAPSVRTLVAPMAVVPDDRPSPGEDDTLLFVGSNTAPNILGLKWFFDEIWPKVRQRRPGARLAVAGNVSRGLDGAPDGVSLLGLVPDLKASYARAGVVISPLTQGSGLKIKLVEAMAHGKAIVATSITLQGVEALVSGAVLCSDEAEAFAEGVISLLGDAGARADFGARALSVARAAFSPEVCYGPLVDWALAGPTRAP